MGGEKGLWAWDFLWLTLFLILMDGVMSSQVQNKSCSPSRCGIITNISYPFRLRGDPANCGDPIFELACENNVTLVHLYSRTYRVLGINYNNFTIRLVDPGIEEGNCSSLPRYFLSLSNFTDDASRDPYDCYTYDASRTELYFRGSFEFLSFKHVGYLNCSDPVRDDAAYLDTASCLNWESRKGGHLYAVAGDLRAMQFKSGCSLKFVATTSLLVPDGSKSYAEIHRMLSYGFEVSWWRQACEKRLCGGPMRGNLYCCRTGWLSKLRSFAEGFCIGVIRTMYVTNEITNLRPSKLRIIIGRVAFTYIIARLFFGTVFLFTLLLYTCHGKYLFMNEVIEDFIRLHDLIPIRYSYSELETMTKGFKNKLGEGGFGTVFKGKLSSGPFVAIKILGKSKANDQEFISEVATIGRIHHSNVVHLVGFCAEGSKRALVYEFMSHGSLDKYIFSKEESISLNYHKIHEISLGVARGIAYLHHGCHMQILHFDIKPHNILLDDNFIPKILDFGLARLYSVDDTTITLTAARGTIGYMAPELFYKNIGGVSYKADVYSFGMLLIEMASQRRNLNPHVEHSSQLYFPLWIYDQFDEKKDIQMEDNLTKEEKDLAKKMFIVALWCIQLKPTDRPSMNKVIEMLEANNVESLEMPPKPSLYPNETILVDDGSNSNQTTPTISVHAQSISSEGISDGI
ncbi:rust resistance kinase Lr10-like [Prosopis cineraria]|uniref:rust resistance kinase Lr10-like n=1 Tax=Prosopis cineraria TaxID=364024 RepID=UPI00241008F8|nr:rust resistance kinase Lr10-like [Prosopis cineraria]